MFAYWLAHKSICVFDAHGAWEQQWVLT